MFALTYFYDTSPGNVNKKDFGFNPNDYDSVEMYCRHFSNLLYLDFILHHKKTTWIEKKQAETEIQIANKKMSYWNRYVIQNGLEKKMTKKCETMKKTWGSL